MIGQRGKLKSGEVVTILQKSEVKVFNTSDFEKCQNNLWKSVIPCWCGYRNVLSLRAEIKNIFVDCRNFGNTAFNLKYHWSLSSFQLCKFCHLF